MAALLARYAECIFWLARYMERAENLARILDVNETFARDSYGATNWVTILRLNADEQRFFELYPTASAKNVMNFYILDQQNPTSIIAAIGAARENARQLRPLISTEMWTQINMFHNRLQGLGPNDIAPQNLQRICAMIKEACQTHTGITEGTFFRDQGWYFYGLGRNLERADQTTRLLDIKYHTLLPSPRDVGTPVDISQWHSLLRSAAGYHAFRRVYPRGLTPAGVAGFLLFNDNFPRSVLVCTREVDNLLNRLNSKYRLRRGTVPMERSDELLGNLASNTIETVISGGLHEYLDALQISFSKLTNDIAQVFFLADQPVPQPT